MRRIQRTIGFGVAAIAVTLLVLSPAAGDAVDENRDLLEKYRQDQPHYARLQQDLTIFQKLGADRQERLRKLDRDLQDETPGMRSRLGRVMQRYTDWLDRLSEADRQSIDRAPDRKSKLQRIREIREQQWLKRLPRAQQEQVAKTLGDDRARLIRRLWDEEWEQRADWQAVARNADVVIKRESMPVRPDQLPDEVRRYLNENLLPLLSKEEERRLREAEGKWPRFMRLLVELLDNHPVSVQGPIGPTRIDDANLPAGVRDYLAKDKTKKHKQLIEASGKWPDFGLALQELRRSTLAKLPPPVESKFMPSQPHQFPKSVQVYLEKRLAPALDEEDRIRLKNAETHWPAYPRLIVELARKHNLPVPLEKPLPGPFELYDRYRFRSVTPEPVPGKRGEPLALLP
jgi:hypothetical protein